jgi:rhamnosyltransferase subunit B
MPLRILFVPFGSEGDVNPLLWLAEGMAARGHEPTFLITPHYGRLVQQHGFSWAAIGAEEEFVRFARDPRVWHPKKGTKMVVQGMLETLPAYREGFAMAGYDFDLVVLSSMAMGAASVAEAKGIPRFTLHMQPALFRSIYDCPVFMEELSWLARSPRWVKRFFFGLVDVFFWETARKLLNAFRRGMDLPPLRNFYTGAFHGAEGVAALFPEWFAPPQPDWPPGVRQFGFPVAICLPRPLPESLEAFLGSGDPPVAWTHGSANFDIQHFQSRALAVSQELKLRCLLISLDPPEGPLPAGAFHIAHARFEDVFPRCRAVVHHGGIGTTAKCIAAAAPQLVIPRSHDQPDNASRIVKLGLGETLSYRRIYSADLSVTLSKLLASKTAPPRCREFQTRVLAANTLAEVCDWAEEIVDFPDRKTMLRPMKRLLLVLACAGFLSASAFAGSCGGCGEKSKEGEKGQDSTKQSLAVVL